MNRTVLNPDYSKILSAFADANDIVVYSSHLFLGLTTVRR